MSNQVDYLCWACLQHFLGRDGEAKTVLQSIRDEEDQTGSVDAENLGNSIRTLAQQLIMYIDSLANQGDGRAGMLEQMESQIESVLRQSIDGVGILSKESARRKPAKRSAVFLRSASGRDKTRGSEGYSRDPFKRVRNRQIMQDLTLGSVLYVLRAYAKMFKIPKADRDFNESKGPLKDCYQASQLLWRTYQCSDFSHYKKHENWNEIARRVTSDIARGTSITDTIPYESPYFFWGMFVIVDIMRGNIFYQTESFQNAYMYYGKALERVRIVYKKVNKNWRSVGRIVTWTVIRAQFERSKIIFDNGLTLKALAEQLECLKFMIIAQAEVANTSPDKRFISRLERAIGFLRVEMEAPIWDKRIIGAMFGFGDTEYAEGCMDSDGIKQKLEKSALKNAWRPDFRISPRAILDQFACIPEEPKDREKSERDNRTERLIAEIFARIAFSLLILRIDEKGSRFLTSGYIRNWLNGFLEPDRLHPDNWSLMALYCRTIVDDSFVAAPNRMFEESLERQFALRLRESIAERKKDYNGQDKPNYSEYLNLLDAVTHNIANLVTIPRRNQNLLMRRGYISRKSAASRVRNGANRGIPENKLVVLRRWQSYNPKLPRTDSHRLRGGGYLLIWQGKGIVIDPGYDFIQNLYEEGFSLEDIHAVVVSHSHPDHDDDLSTLLTMFHEWREYRRKIGIPAGEERKIDLFLNESSFRKFSAWVHSEKMILGRIVPLPQIVWHKDTDEPVKENKVGPRRGENVIIDLTGDDGYCMKIEIVPAWHYDVLNSTGAAGFIFHLCTGDGEPVCKMGYTGDTGAYGLNCDEGGVASQYESCDVLVAHLGDARLWEMSTTIIDKLPDGIFEAVPLSQLLQDWFCRKPQAQAKFDPVKLSPERVREFIHLLISLHLIDERCIDHQCHTNLDPQTDKRMSVIEWLRHLLEKLRSTSSDARSDALIGRESVEELLKELEGLLRQSRSTNKYVNNCIRLFMAAWGHVDANYNDQPKKLTIPEVIYLLLAALCISCRIPWSYTYHLGICGIEALFTNMYISMHSRFAGETLERRKSVQGVFVVGELPEELSSYRHRIARWLNTDIVNKIRNLPGSVQAEGKPKAVYAFTGDSGLHIRLTRSQQQKHGSRDLFEPGIRCDCCNLNREISEEGLAYHPPRKIRETVVKALDSKMIYLCTRKDHHPEYYDNTYYLHLFRPDAKML